MQQDAGKIVQAYLRQIRAALDSGDATEHTHRPALKDLIEALVKDVECRNEPRGSHPEQYFAGIRPEEWEFHIGGYQVLQKWLKDRKARKLTADDLRHYQRIVVALRETIRLTAEIDQAIPKWPMD
jgi:hypothetical protein